LRIKVTSPSFSKNELLVKELKERFSDVEVNSLGIRFSKNNLIDFLQDADAVIVGLEKIDKEVIDKTNLKVVSKYGVGIDNIDTEYLKQKGVKFCFKAGVNSKYVAEFTSEKAFGSGGYLQEKGLIPAPSDERAAVRTAASGLSVAWLADFN